MHTSSFRISWLVLFIAGSCFAATPEPYSATHKPVLHGRHWVAITGKPPGATAGARIFERGGNAVDAACAMLAVVCTMYDDVSWGGETEALIYGPLTEKAVGLNEVGVAAAGDPAELFQEKKVKHVQAKGPPAAETPRQHAG